jgi:hypothetical protein
MHLFRRVALRALSISCGSLVLFLPLEYSVSCRLAVCALLEEGFARLLNRPIDWGESQG